MIRSTRQVVGEWVWSLLNARGRPCTRGGGKIKGLKLLKLGQFLKS